eukprot:TRINITY_DN14628_c0_g2_i2.p1 TRINITY_DN14628_c0_g2~~TRINITY_DN14628_c0_g2_i2.p1  ORF type:complete len:279 (-),score=80.05 TRINITY_DN14628_c0_g2_i2:519-1355(-)
MGAGASAQEGLTALKTASADEVRAAFSDVTDKDKARIGYALLQAERAAAGGSSSSTKPKPAAGAAEIQAAPTASAGGGGGGQGDADIPKEWGWPAEPYEPEDLKEYVKQATALTKHEEWQEQIALRTAGDATQDFMAEKAFGNVMLNKEGSGEDKDGKHHEGIDPNAYKKGRWYRFLNNKEDCHVYVHNYTRDITATRPENFTEMTDEEKKRLKKLGIYIKELPDHIEKIYDTQKVRQWLSALGHRPAQEGECEGLGREPQGYRHGHEGGQSLGRVLG